MGSIVNLDRHEIERRKERIRRAWEYEEVDHIPMGFVLEDFSKYTLREQCQNGELQLEINRTNVERLLRLLPDDYIPTARLWPGYVTIASMFGLEIHWSDNPNQAPGVLHHPISDISQVYELRMPDPAEDGLMPFNLKWLAIFRDNFPEEVSLTGIDLGGPLNTAKDLFDTDLLFTAMYDSPKEFHYFLSLATEVQIQALREILNAVGDINRLTSIDFDPIWAPEGRKGFVSDDVCASLSPGMFREFSLPYNSRIFQLWRGGRLHNCGPHPAIDLYLHHNPEINGLNCSFKYTKPDLPKIKRAFRGKGIVELMYDNGESAGEIIRGYEEVASVLAPDVVAMPVVWLDETWTDDAIRDMHQGLRRVSERYAREMNWTQDG